MGTKTISLEDSAYERLKSAKQQGESFSEVVNRLVRPSRQSLHELSGILDAKTANEVGKIIAEIRREDRTLDLQDPRRGRGGHGRSPR
ncbi:MAG: antitoxin VapB family protein [Thermoplasmata archaeon]|nr:antitoxin VapB family protein [Thermoplasmata archaeon]